MGLSENLKSKKFRMGAAAMGAILLGIFLLKLVASSGTDLPPERSPGSTGSRRPISKPQKREAKASPLFQALKELQDPFRGERPELVELQNKITVTKKEIEYLKASLEARKLQRELRELGGGAVLGSTETKPEKPKPTATKKSSSKPSEKVLVKAILIADEEKTALLVSGGKKSWVHEGEEFDGWKIKKINTDGVVLVRGGKSYVFFYDRSSFAGEGKS